MRLLLVFSILNLSGSAAYSQFIPDSLLYTKQVLNLEFLTKAAEFQNGKSDFLMVRINDSLSDDNHSYRCYYNKDSEIEVTECLRRSFSTSLAESKFLYFT